MRAFRNWIYRLLYKFGVIKVSPWPDPPAGAVARVLYRNVINPKWAMACYRSTDGSVSVTYFTPPEASAAVIKFITHESTPTAEWTIEKEVSLLMNNAAHTAARAEGTEADNERNP
jgi:hypothetical protein